LLHVIYEALDFVYSRPLPFRVVDSPALGGSGFDFSCVAHKLILACSALISFNEFQTQW
jgi:hypothetical protein